MTTKTKKKPMVMDVYLSSVPSYTVRHEVYNDESYIVVPVTMMTEGVRSGSHGPILHTASELGKLVETWNGIPITIGHPQIEGQYVSANSPQVLSDWAVGQIFNANMENDALRAEAWIKEQRIIALSPDTLQRIHDGDEIEVSIGVFSDEIETQGTFQGENYRAIATNYRPNHLALLPDEVGACSLEDGCGIRVNRKGGTKMFVINKENEQEVLKALSKSILLTNETGFSELRSKAQQSLDNKDGNGFTYYLEEMYDNYLVYREHNYNNGERSVKLFKQSYQENAAGDVELTGEAVQVKREVTYSNVPQTNGEEESPKRRRTKFNNNQGKSMPKDCQVCKDKVNALIANKETKFTENDRDWMEALEVNQLELLEPKVIEKEVPGVVTNEQIMSAFQESVKTPEDFLKFMPEGMRDQFKSGMDLQANAKAKMVTAIMANADGVWEKEELDAMPMSSVTKIYKSIAINEDVDDELGVVINPVPQVNTDDTDNDVPVLAPMGVKFKTSQN